MIRFYLALLLIVCLSSTSPGQGRGEYHLRPVKLPQITNCEFEGKKKELPFPSSFAKVAVGGGGRYLACHLPQVRKIAMVDVCDAKIMGYISLPSDDIDLTASAEKLLVVFRDKGIVRRYRLSDLELELTRTFSGASSAQSIVMGGASNGPALFPGAGRSEFRFLDLETLEPANIATKGQTHGMAGFAACWASMNGKLFTGCRTSGSPAGMTD